MNDVPTIELPESFTFDEDGSLTEDFSGYLSDIDEDTLTLTVSGNENIIVSIDNFEVIFGSVQDWNGTETLTFTVNDNQDRAIASDDVDVIITSVNDAPVLGEIVYQEMLEDTELILSIIAEDVDGDSLIFSAISGSPLDVSVSVSGNELIMIPVEDFNGEVVISVSVTDGEYTDNTNFTLNVLPVNDAPLLDEIEPIGTPEELSITILLNAFDIDGDTLTFSALSASPDDVSVSVMENELTLTPSLNFNGLVEIEVTVSDLFLEDTTTFTLLVTPVNDAPVITAQGTLTTVEETSITIIFSDLVVEDVDNDYPEGFTLTVLDSGDFSDFYSVGIDSVSIIPGLDFNGTLVVPVYVNDGEEDYSPFLPALFLPFWAGTSSPPIAPKAAGVLQRFVKEIAPLWCRRVPNLPAAIRISHRQIFYV